MLLMLLTLAACGGGDSSSPPTTTTQIFSDATADGDISLTTGNVVTITQNNTQSVFAGINPTTGTEFRAFLNFPLTGAVPVNATIVSATLDIFIFSIQLTTGSVPILIDLVDFQPPTLFASDFDRTILLPLVSISTTIFQSDLGRHVTLDVTALMKQAQISGQPDFQLRILEDPAAVSDGLIEIDDTTVVADRPNFAPLLTVSYF